VFVGTVRLMTEGEEAFGGKSYGMGHIDVTRYLEAALSNLTVHPKTEGSAITAANPDGKTGYSGWSQPTTSTTQSSRMRIAALPGIAIANVSAADFAASAPLQALTGAYRAEANLNISLDAIESVEMDIIAAIQVFQGAFADRIGQDAPFRRSLCIAADIASPDRGLEGIEIQMISRVFYARIIDYSYGDSFSSALRASVNSAAEEQTPITSGALENADAPVAEPAPTADAAAEAPTLGDRSQQVNIEGRSSDGLKLRRVFERPLAFGVETIAINPYDLGLRCATEGPNKGDIIAKEGTGAADLATFVNQYRTGISWPSFADQMASAPATAISANTPPKSVATSTFVTPPVSVAPPTVVTPFSNTACPDDFDQLTAFEQEGFAGCIQSQ